MELTKHWKWLAAGAVGVGILAYAYNADAADLGGNCCADLEERIAELEATTARKGNRKVTVNVHGQISKGLFFWDYDSYDNVVVSENSSAESFFGVSGKAKIDANWEAGFVLQLGVGGYYSGATLVGFDTNEIYTRTAALYLEGPVGRVTLGHYFQATDAIAEITTANTAVAARMLRLRPLTGPQLGEALDVFDGTRGDIVRYDSPVLGGFQASASWSAGIDDTDVWDVALRYAGEFAGFRVAAGVGYRDGIIIPTYVAAGDSVQVWSGSGSIMHVTSGLFVSGAIGNVSPEGLGDDLRGYHLQAGLEQKFFPIGKTTLFGEWSEIKEDGAPDEMTILGGGIVQSLDAAAMDVFVNLRRLEESSDEAYLGMAGARIKF